MSKQAPQATICKHVGDLPLSHTAFVAVQEAMRVPSHMVNHWQHHGKRAQRPTLDAEPLPSFGAGGEKAWVPLIHCQASSPTAPPLAPGSFSWLGHWTSQGEDSQPRSLGNHRLSAGFKRYLKRLQIISVIYLLDSIYWPGERGCWGHFSKLVIVKVFEVSYTYA